MVVTGNRRLDLDSAAQALSIDVRWLRLAEPVELVPFFGQPVCDWKTSPHTGVTPPEKPEQYGAESENSVNLL
eukprot:2539850-Amphidinium_carterae.2